MAPWGLLCHAQDHAEQEATGRSDAQRGQWFFPDVTAAALCDLVLSDPESITGCLQCIGRLSGRHGHAVCGLVGTFRKTVDGWPCRVRRSVNSVVHGVADVVHLADRRVACFDVLFRDSFLHVLSLVGCGAAPGGICRQRIDGHTDRLYGGAHGVAQPDRQRRRPPADYRQTAGKQSCRCTPHLLDRCSFYCQAGELNRGIWGSRWLPSPTTQEK